jgi:NitT/TauT family transport system permease protein
MTARAKEWGLPAVVLLAAMAVWELLPRLGVVNEIVLPPFSAVITALVELVGSGYFWDSVRITAIETFAGFALGGLVGWLLGTVIGISDVARHAFFPPTVALQMTPTVALAPVLLTWFGFGLTSKIVMAAIVCFFPVLLNSIVGLHQVDQSSRTLMRSLGAGRWEEYRKLLLPASLPILFAGLKFGLTLALVGAIVAEFVGASEGLGVLIKTFNFQLDVAESFACVLVLCIFGLLLWGLMALVERRVVFWKDHV